MNQEHSPPAIARGGGKELNDSTPNASIRKGHGPGDGRAAAASGSGASASTSPADSHSNSERGSPDPAPQLPLSPSFGRASPPPSDRAEQAASTPASEIDGLFDASNSPTGSMDMDDSGYGSSAAAVTMHDAADAEESFDMLANMPPTPGGLVPPSLAADGDLDGGGVGDGGDAEESLTDMLGIRDSSPTTPAAAVTAERQGLRRSARLSASVGKGRRSASRRCHRRRRRR